MCHILQTEQLLRILGERVCRNLWFWPRINIIETIFLKSFVYIDIIKFEHIPSFFFCHWNFPGKTIGSKSWMSHDAIWISWCPPFNFKSLLKSLTLKSTKIPLRLSQMCPFRNLSVLLFQVVRSELWKAIQALICLPGLPSPLPPSDLGSKELATLYQKLICHFVPLCPS